MIVSEAERSVQLTWEIPHASGSCCHQTLISACHHPQLLTTSFERLCFKLCSLIHPWSTNCYQTSDITHQLTLLRRNFSHFLFSTAPTPNYHNKDRGLVCPHAANHLTVEAGEVPPVEQGCIDWGQGGIEDGLCAIGRLTDGVSEQIHLQKGLKQVAQHLEATETFPDFARSSRVLMLLKS